jgi:hypothetical protein
MSLFGVSVLIYNSIKRLDVLKHISSGVKHYDIMNEKKKKILSELIEDSEREVKESKSKLLPLGIFFTLGGIISIITFFIEASYSDFDEDFIAILLYYGLVGIIGGPSIIIYYFKLKHDIKKLNNTDE